MRSSVSARSCVKIARSRQGLGPPGQSNFDIVTAGVRRSGTCSSDTALATEDRNPPSSRAIKATGILMNRFGIGVSHERVWKAVKCTLTTDRAHRRLEWAQLVENAAGNPRESIKSRGSLNSSSIWPMGKHPAEHLGTRSRHPVVRVAHHSYAPHNQVATRGERNDYQMTNALPASRRLHVSNELAPPIREHMGRSLRDRRVHQPDNAVRAGAGTTASCTNRPRGARSYGGSGRAAVA